MVGTSLKKLILSQMKNYSEKKNDQPIKKLLWAPKWIKVETLTRAKTVLLLEKRIKER